MSDLNSAPAWSMPSIRGGRLASTDFAGKAVLLVNTASMCGYTSQYAGLQALQDAYKDQGLVVLAVPSDDFHQEKASDAEVRDFCEMNFGITLPMAATSKVTGPEAHPLFLWLQRQGYTPDWNFNKVLLDRRGHVAGSWGADPEPMGGEIEATVQKVLAD